MSRNVEFIPTLNEEGQEVYNLKIAGIDTCVSLQGDCMQSLRKYHNVDVIQAVCGTLMHLVNEQFILDDYERVEVRDTIIEKLKELDK